MKKSILAGAILATLTGCGTMQQAINAYGGTVVSSAQQANDSYALAWASAACGTSVGAALRNPQLIPALRVLCMPAADVTPSSLLAPSQRAGRE